MIKNKLYPLFKEERMLYTIGCIVASSGILIAGYKIAKYVAHRAVTLRTQDLKRLQQSLLNSDDFVYNVEKQQHFKDITELLKDYYENKNINLKKDE